MRCACGDDNEYERESIEICFVPNFYLTGCVFISNIAISKCNRPSFDRNKQYNKEIGGLHDGIILPKLNHNKSEEKISINISNIDSTYKKIYCFYCF